MTDVLEKVMYIYHSRLKKGDLSVVKSIDIVAQALQNLKKNANVDITLDMLEINACEM